MSSCAIYRFMCVHVCAYACNSSEQDFEDHNAMCADDACRRERDHSTVLGCL